jgi:flagellar protein FlgJ
MKIDTQARMLAAQALQTSSKAAGTDKQMKQTAQDFEAIFVQQVFKEMRRTIPEDSLLPRGQAEEIYADMRDMEAAKQLAGHGGIGLAEMLLEQMQKNNQ